jgi:hypothetical protein
MFQSFILVIEAHVKHMAKSAAKASRKCQRAIVQIDSSSTRQNRGKRLQESVKMMEFRFPQEICKHRDKNFRRGSREPRRKNIAFSG